MKFFALILVLGHLLLPGAQVIPDVADINRFPVLIKGKYGFINTSGSLVIKPEFEAVQEFSEGLCAVRINGRYGFVDTAGKVIIPAIYDYATQFANGLACVYREGKPLFIDEKGNAAFDHSYKVISNFNNGRAYVQTHSEKVGMIDRSGLLVIDTVYKYIGRFYEGVAFVEGLNHETIPTGKKKTINELALINEEGALIMPYGELESISGFYEGLYTVYLAPKNRIGESRCAVIDQRGRVVYVLSKKHSWIESIRNGIVQSSARLETRGQSGDHYDVYQTLDGKTIYDSKQARRGREFSENFAFYENEEDLYSFINRKGQVIARNQFSGLIGEGFRNGMAVVETSRGWGVIDTTGQFISTQRFAKVHEAGIVDGFIFFEDTVSDDTNAHPRYGLANLDGDVFVAPSFQYFDTRGFVNGLLKTFNDGRVIYYNMLGKLVWQEEEWEPQDPQPVNIDYMNRGYFYANYNYTGHGGASYQAEPQQITMLNSFEGAALTVVVPADQEFNFQKNIQGRIVYVANSTADTIRFNAQDSRLYMKMQAKDPEGIWRDIEYLPSSWCGNSYHHVSLPENHYWTFVAPVYDGVFPTKLRIELKYVDPTDEVDLKLRKRYYDWAYRNKRELLIYSNEFEGSINPAQFWRRPQYTPGGIMDPYNE
jgi:hypothetical protein